MRDRPALAVAAMDREGDPELYRSGIESFFSAGNQWFTRRSSCHVTVETGEDLRALYTAVGQGIASLVQGTVSGPTIGLHFQGRIEVGFHLGKRLNIPGRVIELYQSGDQVARVIRLTAERSQRLAPLDIDVHIATAHGGSFKPPSRIDLGRVGSLLAARPGLVALAVNLSGPGSVMTDPVLRSAAAEGVATVVIASRRDADGTPSSGVPASVEVFESTVAAIVALAEQTSSAGLIYIRGPVSVAVACGRYMGKASWVPMRYILGENRYEQFTDPGRK